MAERLAWCAAMSTSAPEPPPRPPKAPTFTLRALPERGKWILEEDGVPRWTGERPYLEVLMKRLQAVDAVLLRHGIDPQSAPKEPKA